MNVHVSLDINVRWVIYLNYPSVPPVQKGLPELRRIACVKKISVFRNITKTSVQPYNILLGFFKDREHGKNIQISTSNSSYWILARIVHALQS